METNEVWMEGMISVQAALEAGRREVSRIYVRKKPLRDEGKLMTLAKRRNVPVERVDDAFFEARASGKTHGGVMALARERAYPAFALAEFDQNPSFIMCLEGIEDPFNLGYAIRSLYAAGVDALLLPERKWTNAECVIMRASAGASEFMPIYQVKDARGAAVELKRAGFAILCAEKAARSVNIYEAKAAFPLLLVVGGEKRGVSSAYTERADAFIEIPYMRPMRHALPTASAASILAFELGRRVKRPKK